jgi:ABC-2 type transport system permease protein
MRLNMEKIKTIIRKDWAEVFKNRFVLFTVAFMPLLFTALPLGLLVAFSGSDLNGGGGDIPSQYLATCPAELTAGECFQVYLVTTFLILFLMLPMVIPVTIASYSIVGEKTTRSLEPLLATPITTTELLIGKSLAAAIPAIAATWLGFLIFSIGTWIIVQNPLVFSAILDPLWLIAIVLVGPLMALLSVTASVMVSSRVNDPRVAEQLSMIVIVPLLALFFGQVTGFFIINRMIILVMAGILAVVDSILLYFAIQLFQRETILTRWK